MFVICSVCGKKFKARTVTRDGLNTILLPARHKALVVTKVLESGITFTRREVCGGIDKEAQAYVEDN